MDLPMRPMPRIHAVLRASLAVGFALLLAGCGLHRANKAYDEGRYEEALAQYREILKSDPTNVKARIGLQRAKSRAAEVLLAKARDYERRGYDDASIHQILQRVVVLDPDNQAATDWFTALDTKMKAKAEAEAAEESVEALKEQMEGQPAIQIEPRNPAPVMLNFASRTSLREILNTLSKSSGVNILMHTSYQDQSVSVVLNNVSFQKALDTLMLQNDLFYRVMDKNTIMVFKNTQQNRENFDNVIIKTYYLSYAEPDPIRGYLVAVNPLLKVFADKRMSTITVRTKREELAVVDRIINQLDKPKAEVMVYLELMEVTQSSLERVGLLPVVGAADTAGVYRIGATLDATGNANQISWWPKGNRPNRTDLKFLVPSLALDALKTDGDARLVASPNVRAVSGEKATVNIGEKISTTQSAISLPTSGAGGAAAGGIAIPGGVGQTTYGYENVGVKIEVEPRVHYNGEVTLKLKADVTTLKASSTAGRPDLGQRTIETYARLRDGETAIFGGLLKDEEQKSLQGVWGLTDIPVIGALFGNTNRNRAKTDVILTVRAVLVRKPNLTTADLVAFNPDEAYSEAGPFAAKKPKAEKKPAPTGEPVATPSAPLKPRNGDAQAPAPAAEKAAETPVSQIQEKAPSPADAQRPAQASDLVIYVSPVTQQIKKGEKAQLNFLVSGGQGLSTGSLDIRISPNLKLSSCTGGDWVAGDGSIDQKPGPDGTLKVGFHRNPAGSDSGTLVVMELEGTGSGNGTVTIQGGTFQAGATPVGGRWVNALITVE
jgi:general secretion pathway protein D